MERADGRRAFISLGNLSRRFERDKDPETITGIINRFIDTILIAGDEPQSWEEAAPKLLLALEPRHFVEPPDVARTVSDQVDCVPVVFDSDIGTMTWVSRHMLEDWSVADDAVFRTATEDLDRELRSATVEFAEVDGRRVAFIASDLPFKASLILAPGFRRLAEPVLGWPLIIAAPRRDFLYLCNLRDRDLIEQLGPVVVEECSSSPYPLTTELLALTDEGLQAIGEFSADA